MRRTARVILIGIALASCAGAALAASGMTVELNQSRRILLHGAAANVIVGDPTVADVAMIDSHSIILMGKGYGATDVMVLDRAGRTLLDGRVTVTAPNEGRVTLYRGVAASDFSCSPRCQAITTSKSAPAQSNTEGPAPAGGASPSGPPVAPLSP